MFGASANRTLITSLVLALVLAGGACAAFRATDPAGPRSEVRLYPVGLADPSARLEEASLAWYQLSQQHGLSDRTQVNLDPHTATLQSLPANLTTPIYLPKVGETEPTEEQTRESLRRFIVEWRRLIGANPEELSLVERVDEPSGIKLARYEQRPFRYPLRGGYGNLSIRFRADRQLVALSSNCLPNAERLQATLAQVSPQVTGEDAVNALKAQPIAITNMGGQQTITLPPNAVLEPRQLVVYALPPPGQTGGLELHLAWEINVTNGPIKTVYFDAVSSQVIAAV
ncbi:MAG TPA: hypothetical protein VHH35_16890 [Pyrinomonadaceae bacterium]|nr:hypothetical protein [Pyrinomonadaceae bacterium]